MKLPIFQTSDKNFSLLQTTWAAIINPIISLAQSNSLILANVSLTTGTNIIQHGLGRALQGWYPVRIRASATFYDNQDTNTTPQTTLVLVSSANVVVNLVVF